jgi:hypothetical protein
VRPRWDIDERGHGVGDARRLLPEARALLERMETPDWVTEDADAHLLPHIRRMCASDDVPLELADGLELDIVTRVVSDAGGFVTHGHTLLLRVTP